MIPPVALDDGVEDNNDGAVVSVVDFGANFCY
jgi:hypothetical protein